jgi:hypothetical protein
MSVMQGFMQPTPMGLNITYTPENFYSTHGDESVLKILRAYNRIEYGIGLMQ